MPAPSINVSLMERKAFSVCAYEERHKPHIISKKKLPPVQGTRSSFSVSLLKSFVQLHFQPLCGLSDVLVPLAPPVHIFRKIRFMHHEDRLTFLYLAPKDDDRHEGMQTAHQLGYRIAWSTRWAALDGMSTPKLNYTRVMLEKNEQLHHTINNTKTKAKLKTKQIKQGAWFSSAKA